jgi:hypothetical protein
MPLITRSGKGSKLSSSEMDNNLLYLESLIGSTSSGATGPQGDAGLPGATGPQGFMGATGPQGDAGLLGATGPQGDAGLPGATGPQGFMGATGPQGDVGLPGAYTTSGLPSATASINIGRIIYISDTQEMAYSNGTNWLVLATSSTIY